MTEWTPRSLAYNDFEKLGEEETRRQLSTGLLDGEVGCFALDWLRQFDDAREVERRASLDAAALSAAKAAATQASAALEANRLARQAQTWAKIANVIAAIAIIVSIIAIVRAKA